MTNSQELKELAHRIMKLYVPKEKYDYICGIIDMAHTLGVDLTENKKNSPSNFRGSEN